MKRITLAEIPPPPADLVKLYFWGENALITWPFLGLLILLAYKQLAWLSARLGHAAVVDLLADLWALLLALALASFLLTMPLCARAYERTVGRAYRARDRALHAGAARAQAEALYEAELAMVHRETDLDKREREYAENYAKFRQEQTDLHFRNLELMESRAQQVQSNKHKARCSGRRRRNGDQSHESVFDHLP